MPKWHLPFEMLLLGDEVGGDWINLKGVVPRNWIDDG